MAEDRHIRINTREDAKQRRAIHIKLVIPMHLGLVLAYLSFYLSNALSLSGPKCQLRERSQRVARYAESRPLPGSGCQRATAIMELVKCNRCSTAPPYIVFLYMARHCATCASCATGTPASLARQASVTQLGAALSRCASLGCVEPVYQYAGPARREGVGRAGGGREVGVGGRGWEEGGKKN